MILPLQEKYRPTTITEILGQPGLQSMLDLFLQRGEFPNFLLHGKPGNGKTSSALAFARDFLGDSFNLNFSELNASDERGIDVVRGQIKDYASSMPARGQPFKILLLDEVEGLTPAAQNALRRTMEKSHKIRFICTTNHLEKIIPAIQSRLIRRYVPPVPSDIITQHLTNICQKESIVIDPTIIDYIVSFVDGDMRQSLQYIQALPEDCSLAFVKEMNPTPSAEEVEFLININQDPDSTYSQRYKAMKDILDTSGLNAERILFYLYEQYKFSEINSNTPKILYWVGSYHQRMLDGGNAEMNLWCCLLEIRQILELS